MRIEAEANLSALIESTEDLIWSVDPHYRLITFNHAFSEHCEQNFGCPAAPGLGLRELLPSVHAEPWPPLFDRALRGDKFRIEMPFIDGRILELVFNPIVVNGETTGVSVFGKDITERKAAGESRRFLAEVVESCEEAIITNAPSGEILTWNHAAEVIYGYTADEAVGQPFYMVIAPEIRELAERQLKELLGGAPLLQTHGVALRKDGSRVHITVSTWPIRNSAGEVTAICTIVHDVSVHYEAEKSRALLASIIESSDDAIHAVNLDGTVASWNRGAEQLFGYTSEEILGKNLAILVLPGSDEQVRQHFGVIRDGCTIWPFDTVLRRKDETWIDVSLTISPIRNSAGEVVGAAAIARDISQRKQAEMQLRDSEERYRATFEQAAVGILHASFEGRILRCNARFAAILGYTAGELACFTVQQITAPDDLADSAELMRQVANGAITEAIEKRYIRKDGALAWVKLTLSIQRDIQGQPLHFIGFIEDISNRKEAEARLARATQALRMSEERYRTAFYTSQDAININRMSDGVFIDCNQAFLDGSGYTREEILGRTTLELGVWADPRDRKAVLEMMCRDSRIRGLEVQFRKKNGELFWAEMSISLMDVDGVPCTLSIMRDISAAKTAEKTIRNLAFYDPLTGLPNRRHLLERLRRPLDGVAPGGRSQALLLVDLDHFKTLNDTLGHQAGDILLQEVAQRILACTHEADTVCRMGGDEFVVLLEDQSKVAEEAAAHAKAVGEKILAALDQPCMIEDRECLSPASIGIAVFGDRQDSTDEILQQAEIALYQAKAAGRNTMRFFSPSLQAAVNARAAMEEELRQGIREKQFLLYYQPQVERGRLTGAEALIRWMHPKRGLIPPNDFIPLAEESRLILPLGDWVLEDACAQIALWAGRKETAHLSVAVNISALQFRQPSFVEQVLETLRRTGANPDNLRLELTESMLVESIEEVIAKMTELKSHGLRFSLDDFGTGYSSLTYLKRLPLDRLKIDRAFVRDMLVDATSGAIAQTILSLGRAMGISVIAEGVETEEQRGYLAALGCHSFQGFLISRPLPLEQFEVFLQSFAESGGPS